MTEILAGDEQLDEAVAVGLEAAARSVDETHREMIAGVIAAGLTRRTYVDEVALLTATLSGLQSAHVKVLVALDRTHAPTGDALYTSRPDGTWELSEILATWEGAIPELVRAVLAQLVRDGLVEAPQVHLIDGGGPERLPVADSDV